MEQAFVAPPVAMPLPLSLLSPDQKVALETIMDWASSSQSTRLPYLTFGGYAGVGKTTLLRVLLAMPEWSRGTAVLSFTGKAVDVLRRKGLRQARTVHSFLYVPEEDVGGRIRFVLKEPQYFRDVRLIVVDEAQTLDTVLFRDLRNLGLPMLLVGDMGQLEPIGENPRLMANPHVKLTQVHRQAEQSAIIRLSQSLRLGDGSFDDVPGEVETGDFYEMLKVIRERQIDQVLCGYNHTRCWLNRAIRGYRGFKGRLPKEGERIICLQNNREHNVFNGMMGIVKSCVAYPSLCMLDVVTEDGRIMAKLPASVMQFGLEKFDATMADPGMTYWDFGYAITTHKAMGSEWDRVAVREEIHQNWDWRRWSYTAATRAAKYVFYSQA